eukprot:4621074-Amphidinium_carterae.1
MTKYLDTRKRGTIGLHPYMGNKGSINMISQRPPMRSRGRYATGPRANTPRPRMRVRPCQTTVEDATLDDYH